MIAFGLVTLISEGLTLASRDLRYRSGESSTAWIVQPWFQTDFEKEKSHVVDNRRNSCCALVTWLFWAKNQPKFSKNRKLDPCFNRDRHHPRHFAPAWNGVDFPAK